MIIKDGICYSTVNTTLYMGWGITVKRDSRIHYLSLRVKCVALVASVLMSAFVSTGCFELKKPKNVKSPDQTKPTVYEPEETTYPSETPTPTASPTPDPKTLVVMDAKEHGLEEADLHGKYDFYKKFAETLEGNEKITLLKPYFYAEFPIISEFIMEKDEEHFLKTLKELNFKYNHNKGADGIYDQAKNVIEIDPGLLSVRGQDAFDSVAFHETIHFIDTHIEGNSTYKQVAYTKTGTFVLYNTVMNNEKSQNLKKVVQSFMLEGCCEKYNAEYFCHAALSYPPRVGFVNGLEYIFGSDKVKKMYFSGETDMNLVRVMQEYEFSNEEILKFFNTTKFGADKNLKAKDCMDPREVLIRLYNSVKGTDYKEDPAFCKILASMDDKNLNKIPSTYRKEISKLKGFDKNELTDFWSYATSKMGGDAKTTIGYYGSPVPIMINGELKVYFILAPAGKQITDYQVAVYDYDFATKEFKGVEIYDSWTPVGGVQDTSEEEAQNERAIEAHESDEVA